MLPENWREKHADFPDMNLDVQRIQYEMNGAGRNHQAGINGAADDTSQRIPSAFVEPIQKRIKSILDHVMSRSIIEPEKKNNADFMKFAKSKI